ncbi:hypothetical protein LEMLEM_LOCUS26794, partial [Lemmus lemmus]
MHLSLDLPLQHPLLTLTPGFGHPNFF